MNRLMARCAPMALIRSFPVIDLRLGPKNRPVVGGEISACFSNCRVGFSGTPLPLIACNCLAYCLLRCIPYQFQDANRPFQMVNDLYASCEFFGHTLPFRRQ